MADGKKVIYYNETDKARKEINPSTDGIISKEYQVEDDAHTIKVDSDNLVFSDPISGDKTLAETLLTVKDEGIQIETPVSEINFVGAGVSTSGTAPGVVQVQISGAAGDTQHKTVTVTSANGEYDFDLIAEGFTKPTGYTVGLTASAGDNARRIIPIVINKDEDGFTIVCYDIVTLNGGVVYDASSSSIGIDVVIAGTTDANVRKSITMFSADGYYDFVFATEGYNNMIDYTVNVTVDGGAISRNVIPVVANKTAASFRIYGYSATALNGGIPLDFSSNNVFLEVMVFGTFV